uniref:Groucho/TLE N-terminal Q-rich domain-containing protein n=1 Tax=Strix occidentalis caurina TaxID=311401 RepID=A0A8D0KWI5_STROC
MAPPVAGGAVTPLWPHGTAGGGGRCAEVGSGSWRDGAGDAGPWMKPADPLRSLKLECEKLVSEKTEMQRHYVMYYEMSYGLNIEMHKQAEIVKRLSAICAQIIPFLTQEHQQQVLQAVERAKQVTMGELNSIVGVSHTRHSWTNVLRTG